MAAPKNVALAKFSKGKKKKVRKTFGIIDRFGNAILSHLAFLGEGHPNFNAVGKLRPKRDDETFTEID